MSDIQKCVHDMYQQVINEQKLENLPQFFAEHYIDHQPQHDDEPNMKGMQQGFKHLFQAFKGYHVQIDRVVQEAPWIAVSLTITGMHSGEFMGIKPSHKEFQVRGIDLLKVEDGLITERDGLFDMQSLLFQLQQLKAAQKHSPQKDGQQFSRIP